MFATGGVYLTVAGGGFDPSSAAFSCILSCGNLSAQAPATADSATSLRCLAPPWPGPACEANLSVLLGLSTVSGGAAVNLVPTWQSVDPTYGPGVGGTRLLVRGAGFDSAGGSGSYRCTFSLPAALSGGAGALDLTRPAEILSPGVALCVSPPWPAAAGTLARFALEGPGVVGAGGPAAFLFADDDGSWSALTPQAYGAQGGGSLTVAGAGFAATGSQVAWALRPPPARQHDSGRGSARVRVDASVVVLVPKPKLGAARRVRHRLVFRRLG